ncbi:MAG: DUF6268 family outer membrane beta-barrel protein [Opitutaceae bacterium]|nr:DUF6268 family outer membrane beta-barrel protein [Opitutaceae bacterium]
MKHSLLRSFIPVATFVAGTTIAAAQGQRPPDTELGLYIAYSARSDARVGEQQLGELAVASARFSATIGSFQALNGVFTYGTTFQWLGIDASDSAPLPDSIAAAGLDLGYSTPVLTDKRLIVGVRPGFNGAGFNVAGTVFLTGKTTETFTWLAGVVLDAHNEYPVLPVVGFVWQPAERWTVALRVPRSEIAYRFNPELEASLGFSFGTGTYKTNAVPVTASGRNLSDSWFDYREIRVGPALAWNVDPNFQIRAETGWVVDRRFEFDDQDVVVRSDDTVYAGLSGVWSW